MGFSLVYHSDKRHTLHGKKKKVLLLLLLFYFCVERGSAALKKFKR
jgi:hypothetical protein